MNKTIISIVVAMDEKRGIGKDNDLLFRIPEDLKRFRNITSGHPVIMGRKTFDSIGRVLPNRLNIIISRNPNYQIPDSKDVVLATSLENAIEIAKKEILNRSFGSAQDRVQDDIQRAEVFIIGGGQVFKEALDKNLVDRLYVTLVKARLPSPGGEANGGQGDFGADTFFPEYSRFKIIKKEDRKEGEYTFSFIDLEK